MSHVLSLSGIFWGLSKFFGRNIFNFMNNLTIYYKLFLAYFSTYETAEIRLGFEKLIKKPKKYLKRGLKKL